MQEILLDYVSLIGFTSLLSVSSLVIHDVITLSRCYVTEADLREVLPSAHACPCNTSFLILKFHMKYEVSLTVRVLAQ